MENQINITLSEVSQSAQNLRSINSKIYDSLSYAQRLMIGLNDLWTSETATTLQIRFEKFASIFLEEKEILENYASFLDQIVSNYDSIESAMNANAGTF